MFETTAFKGSWNQEEQTEEARARVCVCVWGGGGENRKLKGWEEVVGCMMKHSSVLPVVSSTQHSQPRINLLALDEEQIGRL